MLRAFWRSLAALNVFLFVLAVFQSAVCAVLYWNAAVPLPEWLCDEIKTEAEKAGLIVDFAQARADFGGNVSLENVSLRFDGTPEDFFFAQRVSASFGVAPLLFGRVVPKSVRVLDARIAPTYAGVGKNPVVGSVYLDLSKRGQWWRISALNFKAGRLCASVSGFVNANTDFDALVSSLSSRAAAADSKTPQKKLSVSQKFDSVFEKYPDVKRYLDCLSAPDLSLNFAVFDARNYRADIAFVSGGGAFSEGGFSAEIKNFKLNASCRSDSDGVKASARLFAENFSGENLPTLGDVEVRADILPNPDSPALENLDIAVSNISYDGSEIGNIRVRKRSLDFSNWRDRWGVFASFGLHRFGGSLSLSENFDADFKFDGTIDPKLLLARPELADIPELKQLSFPSGIALAGGVKYFADSKNVAVRMDVRAENCIVMDIPVSDVSGEVVFDSAEGVFSARNLDVETVEGWRVRGAYIQNMNTSQYRVRVAGDIRPMAIAHFMEPWWTRVMKDFKFGGKSNFPRADVSVEGTWGKPEYIWCYAKASGGNAQYSGARFSAFSLDVLVNPERITLFDVDINADGRRASGLIEWLYFGNGITTFDEQRIFFDSELDSRELLALGGDDVREVLDVVDFKVPPKLSFSAVLRNPSNNPRKLRDIFNVSAEVAGDTVVLEKATLKNAKFTARSDKIDTQIDNAVFEFCGGAAEGNVALHKSGSTISFEGSMTADKMNQAALTDFFGSLGSSKRDSGGVDGGEKSKSIVDGGENGFVTMSVSLKGDADKIELSQGSGYVSLENSDLIRLNLFGVLSRALSAMRLPFGSFDITYAYSPFEVGGGAVKFPKLEMGGPVMQIKGAAAYDYLRDDIDAALAIRPFGGLTMPIVSSVASLLNPLANTVEVSLDGKLEDPKVGVKVKPIKILQSEKSLIEDIRESL